MPGRLPSESADQDDARQEHLRSAFPHRASDARASDELAEWCRLADTDMIGGLKVAPPYRVEVTRRHDADAPYGWVVYKSGTLEPVARSSSGYVLQEDAWSAAR